MKVEGLKSDLEKVLAIEMLEYHDKNYLSFDNKRNSEEKQELLKDALKRVKELGLIIDK